MAVSGSVFIRVVVDSTGARSSDGKKHQRASAKQIPKARSNREAKIYRKNYPWGVLMPEKTKPNESLICCPRPSLPLSKPTEFGRETHPEIQARLQWFWEGELPWSAPVSMEGIFDAEEVFN